MERKKLADLRELAEFETKQAALLLEGCKNILKDNLAASTAADWTSLYNDKPFPPFVAKNPAPRYKQVALETGVPSKNFLSELLFPSAKNKRLQKETDAKTAYNLRMKQYEEEKAARLAAYEEEREAYLAAQSAYNSEVEKLQFDFEKGRPSALESFARIALDQIRTPDLVRASFDVSCRPEEKLLVVNCMLPGYYELPRALSYRYNQSEEAISAVEMEEREYDLFYRSLVIQIAICALQIIFKVMPARHIQQAAFNGWVNNEDTGESRSSKLCILTCTAARDTFENLDLAGGTPQEIFEGLKGLLAESPQGESSVRPLVSSVSTESIKTTVSAKTGKPPEYRPGEFKQVTSKLVDEMLDQIEKKLLEAVTNKDDVVH